VDIRELNEIKERLEKLEKDAHPPIGLECFEGFKDLCKRIEKLENAILTRSS
jgi:tetrahydromethanopterin S-methyltransferase subunit G